MNRETTSRTKPGKSVGSNAALPMDIGGKVQPQALQLEEAVLGAMMLEQSAVNSVIDVLDPEAFYKEGNGRVFDAIKRLFGRSEPVDLLTVTEELRSQGHLDLVGVQLLSLA